MTWTSNLRWRQHWSLRMPQHHWCSFCPKSIKVATQGILLFLAVPASRSKYPTSWYVPAPNPTDHSFLHINDTTDFIKHIDFLNSTLRPLSFESLLVSADVSSLYTNINHTDGLGACRAALDLRSVKEPPTEQLIRLLELVLTINNFEFDGTHYLQIRGTAMGSV